jgi:lipopolysaccharide biosynthesis protein
MAEPKIGIMCHMYHLDLFWHFRSAFEAVAGADLHLTTCSIDNAHALDAMFADWPTKVSITVVANRGRDIAPKLITLASEHNRYDLVLHLHTKASQPNWREHIISQLTKNVSNILSAFEQNADVGMVAPDYWQPMRHHIAWGSNRSSAEQLMQRMGIDPLDVHTLHFPAGSMFWARPAALKPLFDLGLRIEDFEPEPLGADGSLAHAIERLFYLSCEKAGYRWAKAMQPEEPKPRLYQPAPEAYRLYRMNRQISL